MMTPMKVVYVAGPFRGETAWQIEKNVRAAEALALEVWRVGAAALCPHANSRFFHGSLPDQVFTDGTLALLAVSHAILMMPGWELSTGARGERAWALEHRLPVFYSVEDLEDWLAGKPPADG